MNVASFFRIFAAFACILFIGLIDLFVFRASRNNKISSSNPITDRNAVEYSIIYRPF